MEFTDDEIVTTVEALREYRIRIADESRKFLCQAMIFRFGVELVEMNKRRVKDGEYDQ